jgi:hypothetical protein
MDHDGNNSKQHRKKAKKEFGDGVKIKKERVSTHMNEEKPAAKKGKDKKPNYDLWDEPAAVEVQGFTIFGVIIFEEDYDLIKAKINDQLIY